MISVLALFAAFSGNPAACSAPVARHPSYIIPGALGDVPYRGELTLEAYAPAGERRPAAVIIHGSQGNKTTHVTQLFDVLTRAGFSWFSVDYHEPGDVAEAVRYIRCPGRFNTTNDLYLIGEDTGAQIAFELAAQGGFRGVVTFGAKVRDSGLGTRAPEPAASTLVLMFHGTNDEESPAAAAEALCKKMAHCTFDPVAGASHNFENWHPDQWHWKEEITAWLRQDRRGLWKDIAYARPDGRELLMDAFIPKGNGPFPAVIIAHGGGWEAGDKVTYISPLFEPLARAGFAWFSIDYRLTPFVHIPDELEDVRAAVRYLRRNAGRFHVDPKRLALVGESASGHLVSQVASEPCLGCEVQAVVSFYGVYDFTKFSGNPDWQERFKRAFGDWTPETLQRYSPIFAAKSSMPPTLLIQGTADELAAGTRAYAGRLKETGAKFELLVLDGAPHGMENWEKHPEWGQYKQKLVDWLKSTLEKQ